MAYILNKSNGQQFTILNDGLIENQLSSLSFVGKNVSNYGDEQNQNFLYLLENFANSSVTGGQPRNPTKGQIWFDSSPNINRPLVFDGVSWRPLAISWYDTTTTNSLVNALSNPRYPFSVNQPGDLWINSVSKQLYVITDSSSTTSLIGPEAVPGFDTTRMVSASMLDKFGDSHPVIQLTVNGEVIGIFSRNAFESSSTNQILGFPNVYRGMTFKDYSTATRYPSSSNDVVMFGLHDQLDTSYPRRSIEEHIQNNWYFDNDASLKFGTAGPSMISWSSATSSLNLTSTGSVRLIKGSSQLVFNGSSLTPVSSIELGTQSSPYNALYVTNVTATTVVAMDMYQDGERVLTSTTLPAVGIVGVRGTTNQISVTTNNGTSTISLPTTVEINNLSASNITAASIAGTNITDTGARVITTATIPFSIGSVVGTTNQISVGVVGRTATLSFPASVGMTVLSALTVSAADIYQDGFRVLTTATLPAAAVISVQGTSNQISASNVSGVVTLSLPSTVNISNLSANTATVTRLVASNALVTGFIANNATVTNLVASTANISGSTSVGSLGATSVAVSGNATISSNLTATNLFASGDISGYNLRGAYADFSRQLNATNVSINTLTVLSSISAGAGISATGNISGAQATFSGGTISTLNVDTITAQGASNFSNGTQKIRDVIEQVSIVSSAPTGTVNVNLIGPSVIYYNVDSTSNWTFNFRGNLSVSTNSYLGIGQSVTVTALVKQGSSAGYYPSSCTIDSVTVSPKWFGGVAPSGDPSSVNAFTFTILKTGLGTYDLFASVTKYA